MIEIIEACKKFGYYKNSRMKLLAMDGQKYKWAIEYLDQDYELYETLEEAAYDFAALVKQYGD